MSLFRTVILCGLIYSTHLLAMSPGESAIDFELRDQNDSVVKLSQFKNKYIILEWYNYDCPFVKKHYESQNMQTLQKLYKDNDLVTWISIISSAKGKQGYLETAKDVRAKMNEVGSHADFVLRDIDGKVGRAYEARTTPHIFIIDHKFKVQYAGAIDSIPTADTADLTKAKNYITSSMSKIMLNEKPSPQKTKPYGCSVKY
jgi:hypothetical protein